MFNKKKKEKKTKQQFQVCGHQWDEKFWTDKYGPGRWVYHTRRCTLEKGHGGVHR